MSKQDEYYKRGNNRGSGRGRGGGRGVTNNFFINQAASIILPPQGGNRGRNRGLGHVERRECYSRGGNNSFINQSASIVGSPPGGSRGHNRGYNRGQKHNQSNGGGWKSEKKEQESSGLGLGGSLLMAGAAAAIGYMGWNLFNSSTEEEQQASGSWGSTVQDDTLSVRDDGNARDETECVVCLTNRRRMILIPCNHLCLCEACAVNITENCPVCRCRITEKRRAYF